MKIEASLSSITYRKLIGASAWTLSPLSYVGQEAGTRYSQLATSSSR
jgi:hypothetical protein